MTEPPSSNLALKKADAYGDYVALWDAYRALREGRRVASRTVADLARELRQIMERDGLDSTGIENAARELEWAGRRDT